MAERRRMRGGGGEYIPGQQLRDKTIEDRANQRRAERAKFARQQTVRRWRNLVRNFFLSVLAAILLLLIGSRMMVTGATVVTDDPELSSKLEVAANNYLGSSLFRNFKIGVDRASMAQELTQNNPEAGEVRVSLPLFSTEVKVEVTGRKSAALLITDPDNPVYVIDGEGVIFAEAGEGADLTALPVIRDSTGINPELGQSVTSPTVARFILIMNNRLPEFGYTPVEYEVGEALRQVNIKVKDKPYILKTSTEQGAGQQLAVLRFATNWLQQHKKAPQDYLDLRVDDRVYFR